MISCTEFIPCYSELFTYNIYGPFNEVGYNILKKNNINLKYNVVEDAPTVYGIQYKENKCIKYLFKIFCYHLTD